MWNIIDHLSLSSPIILWILLYCIIYFSPIKNNGLKDLLVQGYFLSLKLLTKERSYLVHILKFWTWMRRFIFVCIKSDFLRDYMISKNKEIFSIFKYFSIWLAFNLSSIMRMVTKLRRRLAFLTLVMDSASLKVHKQMDCYCDYVPFICYYLLELLSNLTCRRADYPNFEALLTLLESFRCYTLSVNYDYRQFQWSFYSFCSDSHGLLMYQDVCWSF